MSRQQRGNALLVVIIVFAVLFALVGLSLERGGLLITQIQQQHLKTSARNLAEAGLSYALYKMGTAAAEYTGQEMVRLEPAGTFKIAVVRLTPANQFEILATGVAPGSAQATEVRTTLRVVAQRSQTNPQSPVKILSREVLL
jgi:type II secretory pathway component PulK